MLLINFITWPVLAVFAYFTYLYISWRILYYKTFSEDIPIAYAHFCHPRMPFSEFFGRPSTKEQERLILETSKRFKTPFVYILVSFHKFVVVCDFDLVQEICIQKSKNYTKPLEMYRILKPYGPNMLASVGDEWKHQRILFNPIFMQENYLRHVSDSTVQCTNKMLNLFVKNDVSDLALKKPFTNLTLDILSTSVFGYETKALEELSLGKFESDQIPKNVGMTLVDSLMHLIEGLVFHNFAPKILLKLPFFKKQMNSVHDFEEYARFILQKCKKNLEEDNSNEDVNDSLVKLMVQSQAGETGVEFTDMELISNMFIFFFAGHETTASTMHWTMVMLSRNPKIQQKVFKEVSEILEDKNGTFDDYKKLQYTQSTIKEVLRLHSPIKQTVKKSLQKTTLGGRDFPKGTVFQLLMACYHKDEKLWENPLEFLPDRFIQSPHPKGYIPFSYGKRNCIGSKFAEVEATMILATIIQKYSIHLKEGIDSSTYEEEVSFITSSPKYNHPFVLRKRKIKFD
eukprot:gene4020-7276_t